MLPRNGYPERIIQKCIMDFQRDLALNPAILDLPKISGRGAAKWQLMNDHRYPWNSQDADPNKVDDEGQSQDASDDATSVGPPWVPTFFGPYIPGFSERLRTLLAKHGVRSWFSYGGKIQESVNSSKDVLHDSKGQNAI